MAESKAEDQVAVDQVVPPVDQATQDKQEAIPPSKEVENHQTAQDLDSNLQTPSKELELFDRNRGEIVEGEIVEPTNSSKEKEEPQDIIDAEIVGEQQHEPVSLIKKQANQQPRIEVEIPDFQAQEPIQGVNVMGLMRDQVRKVKNKISLARIKAAVNVVGHIYNRRAKDVETNRARDLAMVNKKFTDNTLEATGLNPKSPGFSQVEKDIFVEQITSQGRQRLSQMGIEKDMSPEEQVARYTVNTREGLGHVRGAWQEQTAQTHAIHDTSLQNLNTQRAKGQKKAKKIAKIAAIGAAAIGIGATTVAALMIAPVATVTTLAVGAAFAGYKWRKEALQVSKDQMNKVKDSKAYQASKDGVNTLKVEGAKVIHASRDGLSDLQAKMKGALAHRKAKKADNKTLKATYLDAKRDRVAGVREKLLNLAKDTQQPTSAFKTPNRDTNDRDNVFA